MLVGAVVECARPVLTIAPVSLTPVTLPLDVIKITSNFNIISYFMTVSQEEHMPRLYPVPLLSAFASSLSRLLFPLVSRRQNQPEIIALQHDTLLNL